MEIVRVNNTTARLLMLPATDKFPARLLPPGGTNMELEHLDGLEGNAVINDWILSNLLEIETHGTEKPEGPIPPDTLLAYSEKASVSLVEIEENVDTLAMWKKNETRKSVLKAIDDRVKKLK